MAFDLDQNDSGLAWGKGGRGSSIAAGREAGGHRAGREAPAQPISILFVSHILFGQLGPGLIWGVEWGWWVPGREACLLGLIQ